MSSHSCRSRTQRLLTFFFRRQQQPTWVLGLLLFSLASSASTTTASKMLAGIRRMSGAPTAFATPFSTPARRSVVARKTTSTTTTHLLRQRAATTTSKRTPFESLCFWQQQQQQHQRRCWETSTSMSMTLSSSSSFQEGDFISKQKKISQDATNSSQKLAQLDDNSSSSSRRQHHLEHQQRVFDALADSFANGETLSSELIPVYEQLAKRIILSHTPATTKPESTTTTNNSTTIRILDVACGTGALWPFLVQAAMSSSDHHPNNGYRLEVTGVELSSRMVERAQEHARILQQHQQQQQDQHSFTVVKADIMEYEPPQQQQPFDLVIANACFANFWDPEAVLERVAPLLHCNGTLLVTHPLGSAFVERLHQQDPATVPRTLPTSRRAWSKLITTRPWRLVELVDNVVANEASALPNSNDDDAPSVAPFYLAALRRVRARALPNVMRLRGAVDTGYGRGGKKLGFPTANLPSRLFQNALQNVTPGVYFGWALLEDNDFMNNKAKLGRNIPHKAVVNVGFSPTFEGQENSEKIVEAHLIFDTEHVSPLDPPDFYHETMRLQLIGFLRPEIKFPSFPALIAQIRQDVRDAQIALDDDDPYGTLARDGFLRVQHTNEAATTGSTTTTPWIGSSGGDATASWEIQTIGLALDNVRAAI